MGLLNKVFFKIGYMSASNPFTAAFLGVAVTVVCAFGFINQRVTVSISAISYTLAQYRVIRKSCGFRHLRVRI